MLQAAGGDRADLGQGAVPVGALLPDAGDEIAQGVDPTGGQTRGDGFVNPGEDRIPGPRGLRDAFLESGYGLAQALPQPLVAAGPARGDGIGDRIDRLELLDEFTLIVEALGIVLRLEVREGRRGVIRHGDAARRNPQQLDEARALLAGGGDQGVVDPAQGGFGFGEIGAGVQVALAQGGEVQPVEVTAKQGEMVKAQPARVAGRCRRVFGGDHF